MRSEKQLKPGPKTVVMEPNPVVKLEIGVSKAEAIAFMHIVAKMYGYSVTEL